MYFSKFFITLLPFFAAGLVSSASSDSSRDLFELKPEEPKPNENEGTEEEHPREYVRGRSLVYHRYVSHESSRSKKIHLPSKSVPSSKHFSKSVPSPKHAPKPVPPPVSSKSAPKPVRPPVSSKSAPKPVYPPPGKGGKGYVPPPGKGTSFTCVAVRNHSTLFDKTTYWFSFRKGQGVRSA